MDWARLPPLSSLRAFEAAARHESFSAAGRELNVTHAAIAQQVRRLEEALGSALLRREGRGLRLTPKGTLLAAGLGEGFARIRDAVAAAVETKADRPLRLTMTPSFAVHWMLPRISLFRAENPDIELMLNPSPELVDLAAENYDLAIRWGNGIWPGVEAEKLLSSHFVVVASRDLVDERKVETPADLVGLPWLVEFGTDELTVWLRRHGIDASGKHDVTQLPGYMLAPALRTGKGVAATARLFAEEDIAAGHLEVLFEENDESVGYHVVRRPGPVRPAVKRFIAWLKREARAG